MKSIDRNDKKVVEDKDFFFIIENEEEEEKKDDEEEMTSSKMRNMIEKWIESKFCPEMRKEIFGKITKSKKFCEKENITEM